MKRSITRSPIGGRPLLQEQPSVLLGCRICSCFLFSRRCRSGCFHSCETKRAGACRTAPPGRPLSLTRWHFLAICQISKSNLNTDLPVGVTGAPRKPRAQLFATSQAPDGGGVESPHCRRLTEQKRMTTIETDAAGPASYRPC